jgi:hypothetical protein
MDGFLPYHKFSGCGKDVPTSKATTEHLMKRETKKFKN